MLYVERLIAPGVINTMPDKTLRAFAEHGNVARALDSAGDAAASVLSAAAAEGVDLDGDHQRARARGRELVLRLLHRAACLHRVQGGLADRGPMSGARFNRQQHPHVLIAGGGVAGLETLLALRALAGERVDITVVAPELQFFNRSMSVEQPFKPKRGRGIGWRSLRRARRPLGPWSMDHVDHEDRVAITKDAGPHLLRHARACLGAHLEQWLSRGPSTYRGGSRRHRATTGVATAPTTASSWIGYQRRSQEAGLRQTGRAELAAAAV